MFDQIKQVIMITGATRGLGYTLAQHFAKQGANLAICARGENEIKTVQNELEKYGAEVVALSADVSNPNDVERFISVTENYFGHIDTLINNASIFGPGPLYLADYPDLALKNVLEINIMNPFLMTKRVLPGMLARHKGSIINLTSEVGKTGYAEWGAYSISKFAVEGMTQIWADELIDTGVRINLVDPGEMDTAMHKIAVPNCEYELAQPSDVIDVFDYLASSESQFVTGQRFEAQSFTRKGV
ncbi:SDR family NAD(P)-dependent oxidoreductase [Halalkalibacter alkaliphilus]|uniref:SDR family oxidoreductase n=1 Tax=Halalkalibacter alkaliphilus TaxID=2917993 RepID=A0A9X2CTX1_9BACI|nr:SDR family oxidoreductase [Halalkalibacter alkaliphilus]MCL7747899.1 SDR family oxidoreductase [Halalkalibacter alkaliphilus]